MTVAANTASPTLQPSTMASGLSRRKARKARRSTLASHGSAAAVCTRHSTNQHANSLGNCSVILPNDIEPLKTRGFGFVDGLLLDQSFHPSGNRREKRL